MFSQLNLWLHSGCRDERLVYAILRGLLTLALCLAETSKQIRSVMGMQRKYQSRHIAVIVTIPISLLDELGFMHHSHITGSGHVCREPSLTQ
jgi:hypothetical protein